MLHRIRILTIRLFAYAMRGVFAVVIAATFAIGVWRVDVGQVFRKLSSKPPRPAVTWHAAPSQTPVPATAIVPRSNRTETSSASMKSVRPRTATRSKILEFTESPRAVRSESAEAGVTFPSVPNSATTDRAEVAWKPEVVILPTAANVPESLPPAPPAVPPAPLLPVVPPAPAAPWSESIPLPNAVPAAPAAAAPVSALAQPVAPPVQLGAFLSHGTITPADVRAMALRNNKEIAVLGYLPPSNEALVDVEASVFDPAFNVALMGGNYNRQVSTQVQALGPPIPELKTSFWQPLNGLNQVYLEKQFVTGGRFQIGVGQNYTNYSPAGSGVFVNPAYESSINLQLDQPLFRGRGAAWTTALLQIARANQDQSWHAFIATVSQILRDADYAYWDLYAAFQEWEVRDLAVRQAEETLHREQGRLQLGEGSVPDVAQAEEQYEAFRVARADAENRLVNAQRNLRRVMGLPPSDPRPLIPAEPATDAPVNLDWDFAAEEARQRPELAAQQAAVAAAEAELARRRNGLLPDLSVRAIYSISGLDDNFDQAWNTVGDVQYNDWTAGVIYRQPLGRRSDRALADRAAITLSMETARLRQLEHEVLHQLDAALQHVQSTQQLLEMHRKRREAAAVQLAARRELYLENRATLRDQLDAEVRYASALFDESNARVAYQRSLTEWNFARGALAEAGIAAAQ